MLNEAQDVRCIFYGPQTGMGKRSKKTIRSSGYLNYKPVWTPRLYMFQILRQLLIDKPAVVHFDFQVTTFSENYFEMAFFPLLVVTLKILRFRVVLTVHDVVSLAVLKEIMARRFSAVLTFCFLILYYRLLSVSNVIIVHLNTLKSILVNAYKLRPNAIIVIPFGLCDFERQASATLDTYKNAIGNRAVVLAFGLIAPRKGLEYLIEAFSLVGKNHPEAMLVIAGPPDPKNPGYAKAMLSKARTTLASNQFSYSGYLDEESAHCLISIARAIALPYLHSYATSGTLYCAMAHLKPVIASAIETFVDELRQYNGGLMPRPRDSKQIADSIERILDDEEIVKEASHFMAEKARTHSRKLIISRTLQTYEDNLRITGWRSNLSSTITQRPPLRTT